MNILLIGINSKYIHPAMGIFQLVANYHQKNPLDYKEFTIKDNIFSIVDYINNHEATLVGISVYIFNISIIQKILPQIKNKIIFLGGPEASFKAFELLSNYNVSYIIKGEGENSFNCLVQYLNNDISINAVPNLYYHNNNEIKYTFNEILNLENIKHDLTLIKDYHNRICYLESSRGCYYNCTYCLASTEKPVRFFPIDEVLNNILFLLENKAKTIKFLDRSFNINKEYIKRILLFLKEHDNNFSTFQFEIVGDNFDDELISLINSLRPKMIRFEIGIQSTNEKTIKAIKRIQNFDKLKHNILKIKDNIIIHTDLIAGLPFEGLESFKKSFNDTFLLFTEELQLGILKELKGTYISKTKDDYKYVFASESPYEVIENMFITKDELDKIRLVEKAVDRFYNYGYYKRTIYYLFKELLLNPFDTFYEVMKHIESIKPTSMYQFDELALEFYNSLCKLDIINKNKLLYIIKIDYLSKHKQKPKIWWETNITREKRKEYYELFSKEYNLNIEELYRYGHLEIYNNEIYLINYKDHNQYQK